MTTRSRAISLFTLEEILEIVSGKLLAGEVSHALKRKIRRVVSDSRIARPDDLFVAFEGDRFDGRTFVPNVLGVGAAAIVKEPYRPPSFPKLRIEPVLIGVRDTLLAYQQLATHHRNRFAIPVVAITGSNGKTTTKEMTAAVLAQRWRTLKTEGNLNNRIGVPQTLFLLTPRHEAAVIEMGVDQQGQTTRLCEVARPTVGVITNIGPDHLEFFGSMEGSAQAKAELLDLLPADGAVALNADDQYFDYLAARARCRVVSFGVSSKADVRAVQSRDRNGGGSAFGLILPGRVRPVAVRLKTYGQHNIQNALAAAAIGFVLGVPAAAIVEGLGRFRPAAMRSQIISTHGVRVINDCYNANPASMQAAVQLLAELGVKQRTIAVLGDMLELGPEAKHMHRAVGTFLAGRGITHLIACGVLGRELAQGARSGGMSADRIIEVSDAAAAGATLKSMVQQGDVVLVKGSRGMQMEQVVETVTGMRRAAKKAS
jgi:UDP-N-acetylmuramoyl-tripeptide--D-alanyl-D-alanine ligase